MRCYSPYVRQGEIDRCADINLIEGSSVHASAFTVEFNKPSSFVSIAALCWVPKFFILLNERRKPCKNANMKEEDVCCTYVDKVSSLYHEVFDHPAQKKWINKIISITFKFARELHSCETRDQRSDMIVCT